MKKFLCVILIVSALGIAPAATLKVDASGGMDMAIGYSAGSYDSENYPDSRSANMYATTDGGMTWLNSGNTNAELAYQFTITDGVVLGLVMQNFGNLTDGSTEMRGLTVIGADGITEVFKAGVINPAVYPTVSHQNPLISGVGISEGATATFVDTDGQAWQIAYEFIVGGAGGDIVSNLSLNTDGSGVNDHLATLTFTAVHESVTVVRPVIYKTDEPIDMSPTLEWASGTDPAIIQHILYFSTDQNWVANALPTDSGAIVLPVETETYQHPEMLDYKTTYFWRVDEATGDLSHPDNVETGAVWTFMTESEPVPPCAGLLFDGDVDGDCFVDINDLMFLAQDWLLVGDELKGDIDGSNDVDLIDFNYVSRDWLTQVNNNPTNILVVSAHPDDEGIFGGGVLPYYAQVKQIPVTLLTLVTRNSNGNDPLMSGSASRVQELRNAVDIYAGMPLGSGTINELGHYVTGNITLVEGGLIDTGCCGMHPLDSWSDAGDGYGWGTSSGVTQVTPGFGNMMGLTEGRSVAQWVIAREIRRFQPEVVVTVHDLEGDYGHSNHTAGAIGIIEAYDLAADAFVEIDGLDPWLAQKLYLRGDSYDNHATITWDDFLSDGGINSLFHDYTEDHSISGNSPHQVADWALTQHASQGDYDVSTVYRAGERLDGHHSEWWTLYRSTVGYDTLSTFTVPGDVTGSTYTHWAIGDFLENITLVN